MLAGYKQFLWNFTFPRIIHCLPSWIDFCILTAGQKSDDLLRLCALHGWSYLSVQLNNVCLIQNVVIKLHPHAQFIFKLDEDMFLTYDYFRRMISAYELAEKSSFVPGVVAPLITINYYASRRILELFNCVDAFEALFGKTRYYQTEKSAIFRNPAIAMFFWGEGNYLPTIDKMNAILSNGPQTVRPIPVRFNIGAILYSRSLWEEMGFFPVKRNKWYGMGDDEIALNTYCPYHMKPVMVSENIIVGHFSYSPQVEGMKQYLYSHEDLFRYPQQTLPERQVQTIERPR